MVYMERTETKTKEIIPGFFGRNSWQLSDESDEEDGVTPLETDLNIEDEEDEEEIDFSEEKFKEE